MGEGYSADGEEMSALAPGIVVAVLGYADDGQGGW
jgi:hypothetical protein